MRCFLAVELSDETKDKLCKAQAELKTMGLDASYPKPEQMHVTLCFFGEITENELKDKTNRLGGFSFPSFDLRLQTVGFFPNESFVRVVWAGTKSKELLELQRLASEKLGYKDDKPFTGHVTLARIRTPRGRENLAEFKRKHLDADFGATHVNRIVFKKSLLSPQGPAYENLAEIPLKH